MYTDHIWCAVVAVQLYVRIFSLSLLVCLFPSLHQENQEEDSRYPHHRQLLKTAAQPTALAAHKALPVPVTVQPNRGRG
ncbi:hypothetical protein JD844_017612 [Phrynosoma platyrhinos]|uniref:Secreted protein n=1 Tax=Phrynosoma platyrhinos TaxID=52577 RepID=A0ABQ7SMA8_PHRPL|nr:hypothetical protein JD844_017612 [Phrynosoma platyrhinos]